MLHRIVPAGFQDVVEAYHIALDVGIRILDGIPHPRLGGQVHHNVEVVLLKKLVHQGLIGNIPPEKGIHDALRNGLFDGPEPILLERRIVVIVHVVQPHDGGPRPGKLLEEPQNQVAAYESGRTGNKNRHSIAYYSFEKSLILCSSLRRQTRRRPPLEETMYPSSPCRTTREASSAWTTQSRHS